jgi:serine/threonine protein kinase
MQVDDLILTKSLGKGAFGEVFLTQKKGSKEFYATKRLDRAFSEKPENIKLLSNEITLLKKINHPNIVRLIDLKKTKSHCYIVMEYCNGGDLSGCLKKYKEAYRRPFSEEIVQYIMRQVVNGIYFLHSNKIVHRDLKLDNILVTFPSENDKKSLNMMKAIAKIIDFGFATRLKASKSNLTYTILGTPANMAPQILENMQQRTPNHQGYDEKVDIWSLGTLCYEMLVGHMAFCGHSMQELSQKVKQGTYSLPTNLSKEVISFIDSMLQTDPNKRSSARDLLKHDFLVKNVKQFQPIDVRKIQGMVSGGVINVNSNSNSGKTGNLTQTVWDIFNGPGIITQQPVRPAQQVGIPLQQPMPHMQVPHQQAYMVPSGIPPQQQFINPGYMPQMKMGYY